MVQRVTEPDRSNQVVAQHELLSASFVAIEPDPAPLFDQIRHALTPSMFSEFQRLCGHHVECEALRARRPALDKRRSQLRLLSQKHRFNVRLATAIAGALIAAVDGAARLSLHERSLLNGAIGYFLEVEEEDELRDPAASRTTRAWFAACSR